MVSDGTAGVRRRPFAGVFGASAPAHAAPGKLAAEKLRERYGARARVLTLPNQDGRKADWTEYLLPVQERRGFAIEFQYADFGGEWASAGVFRASRHVAGADASSEYQLPDDLGAHRLWRMQIRDSAPDEELAVREVRFLAGSGADAGSRGAAGSEETSIPTQSRTDAAET